MIKQVRFLEVKGVRYLCAADVSDYVREIAASEETDVRNRLNEAANNLQKRNR